MVVKLPYKFPINSVVVYLANDNWLHFNFEIGCMVP